MKQTKYLRFIYYGIAQTKNMISVHKKAPHYKLTSDYVLYYNDKVIILERDQVFKLAGFELSKHSAKSPFHYENDIIRLPNSILTKL